jgi:excisionase family DNA binding protein
MDKLMLSKSETGRILGLSQSTIDRMIAAGRIAIRRFGKRVLICRSEIERLTKPSTSNASQSDNGQEPAGQPGSKF